MNVSKPSVDFHLQTLSRNYGVYTFEEQARIRGSSVCVVGLGCIGGVVALALARLGVEKMTLVDGDKYELVNINRQPMAFMSKLGMFKTQVADAMLRDINPIMKLITFRKYFDLYNCDEILNGVDVVVQCIDDMKSRVLLHRRCLSRIIPSITMSGQPPFRSIVSTLLPGGPNYETLFGLVDISGMTDNEVSKADELFKKLKFERAQTAIKVGADVNWEKDFKNGTAGWAVTPERTYIAAILQVHECVRVILGKQPLASAPQAIIVDLTDVPNIVRIASPAQDEKWASNGHWDYKYF